MSHQGSGPSFIGLKRMQSPGGPIEPNKYWKRETAKKCGSCSLNIRSENHKCGSGHAGSSSCPRLTSEAR